MENRFAVYEDSCVTCAWVHSFTHGSSGLNMVYVQIIGSYDEVVWIVIELDMLPGG